MSDGKVTVQFDKERETKNTVRYAEAGEEGRLGTIYVPKSTLAEIGEPDTIRVTIEAAR
jgi:hypothetical protein